MSKDIWHTSKEKPEQFRYYLEEYDRFSNGIGYLINKRYGGGNTIDDLTTKRWCYVDELLALETELDRTRKALDVAVDKLKGVKAYYDDSYADPHFVNWHIVAQRLANDADDAIKVITALEQKDD